jgi:predicted AAA+ superfamily ATPase
MIERILVKEIGEQFFKGKVILLHGPRQVGKTTLLNQILNNSQEDVSKLNADDPVNRKLLTHPNTEHLRQIIGKYKVVFIDEAQQIPDIGLTAKLIFDTFNDIQLILSGSSSFELASSTQEPLTGRKRTYFLFPVSWREWQDHIGFVKAEQDLENRLVFGFYPDVLNQLDNQEIVLRELAESYLYKDVLLFGNLKKPNEIKSLLQALSFQVGSEISYNELGQITGLDPKTVEKYIDILEKAYIVFRLNSFGRNLRNEINTGKKIYFYDNGVRNAVISQFQPFQIRQDVGVLWENFIISERKKRNSYLNYFTNTFFWRTVQQQEIDYIEEHNGAISAFEIKFNPKRKLKISKTFTNAYEANVALVNRSNFREFV